MAPQVGSALASCLVLVFLRHFMPGGMEAEAIPLFPRHLNGARTSMWLQHFPLFLYPTFNRFSRSYSSLRGPSLGGDPVFLRPCRKTKAGSLHPRPRYFAKSTCQPLNYRMRLNFNGLLMYNPSPKYRIGAKK